MFCWHIVLLPTSLDNLSGLSFVSIVWWTSSVIVSVLFSLLRLSLEYLWICTQVLIYQSSICVSENPNQTWRWSILFFNLQRCAVQRIGQDVRGELLEAPPSIGYHGGHRYPIPPPAHKRKSIIILRSDTYFINSQTPSHNYPRIYTQERPRIYPHSQESLK